MKNNHMKNNEVRVIKIAGKAIDELLWELLNKYGEVLLDLPENSETIFRMNWDKARDELTFYALRLEEPYPVDFSTIDDYIEKETGITTDSVFNSDLIPYRSIYLNSQ